MSSKPTPAAEAALQRMTTRRKCDVEFQADLDGWLGDEFRDGLAAQERGEDPTPLRVAQDSTTIVK